MTVATTNIASNVIYVDFKKKTKEREHKTFAFTCALCNATYTYDSAIDTTMPRFVVARKNTICEKCVNAMYAVIHPPE